MTHQTRAKSGPATHLAAFLFLFILAPCTHGQTPSNVNLTYSWLPIRRTHGVITAVGPYPLPLSLTFPKGLTPLGGQAFVCTVNRPHPLSDITFYFPSRQETSVLNWQRHLPGNYPFPSQTFSPKPPKKEITGKNNMWVKFADVTWPHGLISLTWMGEPGFSNPGWKSPPPEIQTKIHTLFAAPSPVAHEKRLISLCVNYWIYRKLPPPLTPTKK